MRYVFNKCGADPATRWIRQLYRLRVRVDGQLSGDQLDRPVPRRVPVRLPHMERRRIAPLHVARRCRPRRSRAVLARRDGTGVVQRARTTTLASVRAPHLTSRSANEDFPYSRLCVARCESCPARECREFGRVWAADQIVLESPRCRPCAEHPSLLQRAAILGREDVLFVDLRLHALPAQVRSAAAVDPNSARDASAQRSAACASPSGSVTAAMPGRRGRPQRGARAHLIRNRVGRQSVRVGIARHPLLFEGGDYMAAGPARRACAPRPIQRKFGGVRPSRPA